MAKETVSVRFDAETSGYTSKVDAAAKSTDKLGESAERASKKGEGLGKGMGKGADEATTKLGRLSKAVTEHGGSMETAGNSMMIFGGALTAAAVGAGKAAMDWESAWAGVTKTVDGSDEAMAKLEGDLRQLAKTLPATHTEIAAVAEAAGQLGVKQEDIAGFTRTMIDLGETTNLTADEAATSLAQFMNIMGTAGQDVDRLGSTLVALGNDGASTEKDILNMSMRVAAVGKQMGMTEAEVMALSSAMSSVGIESEAGGTAISNVMKKIDAAVRDGGESLTGWAEAAGVSAQEFATAWQEDPAQAMVTLTQGLGDVAASGGDVNGMLADLGVTGIREADTMLRLAQSGDLLADSLTTGANAWEINMALAKEAETRYATAESKIAIAWNNIKDSAIDAGAGILPVVAVFAEGVAAIAGAFSALPGPVKSALGILGGVSGVAILAAGGVLRLVPAINDTAIAFGKLSKASPGGMRAIKTLGTSLAGIAVGVGAAAAVVAGLTALYNSTRPAAKGMEEVVGQMQKFAETGDMVHIDEMFQFDSVITNIDGFTDALDHINLDNPIKHIQSFGDTVFGMNNPMSEAREMFATLDQTLASMDLGTAAEQFDQLRAKAEAAGHIEFSTWQELEKSMPAYAASVREAANANGLAANDADLMRIAVGLLDPAVAAAGDSADGATGDVEGMGEAMEMTAEEAETLQKAIDDAVAAIEGMGAEGRTVAEAQDAFQASIRGVTESIKENGQSLDNTTEKGAANREALRGLATDGAAAAARIAEFGGTQEEVQAQLMGTYDSLVTAGAQFGLTAAEADLLARDMLGIPRDVDITTYMDEQAANIAQLTKNQIEAIPDGIHVIANMSDDAYAQAVKTAEGIKAVPGYKNVSIAVDDKGTPGKVQARINAVTGKEEFIFVKDDGTSEDVQKQIMRINGKDVEVYVRDDGTVVMTQRGIDGIRGKSVHIGVTSNASDVKAQINSIRGKTVRVDVVRRNLGQAGVATGGIAALGYFPSAGSLPGYAMGRLPYTGRGTDRIMGVNDEGWPVARVNDGEGIIREPMTRKHLSLLSAINDDDTNRIKRLVEALPGHAQGRVEAPRQWSGATAADRFDYDRLASSLGERAGFQNTQYISTQDPTAAAKVARGEFEHMYEVNGL